MIVIVLVVEGLSTFGSYYLILNSSTSLSHYFIHNGYLHNETNILSIPESLHSILPVNILQMAEKKSRT
jgi:hypothetical protein